MELLAGEFGDLSPQELAAPVNTVAVSLDPGETGELTACVQRANSGYQLIHKMNCRQAQVFWSQGSLSHFICVN